MAERGYYDSLAFVKSLTESGFTQSQAEQLCFLFKDIVNYIAEDIKKECVTKPGQVSKLCSYLNRWADKRSFKNFFQDLAIQQVMIHIGSLKKDMIILEKSEFFALRSENEVNSNVKKNIKNVKLKYWVI